MCACFGDAVPLERRKERRAEGGKERKVPESLVIAIKKERAQPAARGSA